MRLFAVALILLLAGCSAPHAAKTSVAASTATATHAQAAAGAASEAARLPAVFHTQGVFGPEAETKVSGTITATSHNITLEFQVDPGATALVAELVWHDAASDLDLAIQGPEFCKVPITQVPQCLANAFFGDASGTGMWRSEGGLPGQGDSPVSIRLSAQDVASAGCREECTWGLQAWAKATPGVQFDLYASVFYGTQPADGYTAVPA